MASNPASCCWKPVMCHFYVRDAGYFIQNPASRLNGDLCCLRVHLDTFVTKQSCEPSIQLAGLALRGWHPYLPASVTSSAICISRPCINLHILRDCTRSGQNASGFLYAASAMVLSFFMLGHMAYRWPHASCDELAWLFCFITSLLGIM